jgi:hypothetical protein
LWNELLVPQSKTASDVFASEVFTFRADLHRWVSAEGLPTG